MEDDHWWKMTFGGRQPLQEDDLWWKMKFGERRPLVEDDLRWKITFSDRQLLVEDDPCMLSSPLCGIFSECSPQCWDEQKEIIFDWVLKVKVKW